MTHSVTSVIMQLTLYKTRLWLDIFAKSFNYWYFSDLKVARKAMSTNISIYICYSYYLIQWEIIRRLMMKWVKCQLYRYANCVRKIVVWFADQFTLTISNTVACIAMWSSIICIILVLVPYYCLLDIYLLYVDQWCQLIKEMEFPMANKGLRIK